MDRSLVREHARSFLNKSVNIIIDRPIGYEHRKGEKTLVYPINYGYIPGVLGGDGEELDVYVLGSALPIAETTATVIGIVYRENDCEDKLIASADGRVYSASEIANEIRFQEKYYETYVESADGTVAWVKEG